MNDSVLFVPDMNKSLEVQTNASDFALGGVFLPEENSVSYESRKLLDAERRYTAQEKELLDVLGSMFVVETNNSTVCHFLSHPKLTAKQARWQEFLTKFDFHIECQVGCTNHVAVDLSRKAEFVALRMLATMSTSFVATSVKERIKENLDKDLVARIVLKLVCEGKACQFWEEDTYEGVS